jgi:VanZ family protein
MAVIFVFSSQPASISDQQSGAVLSLVTSTGIDASMYAVRKMAHVGAYIVLGALVYDLFRHYGQRALVAAILSVLVCGLYAATDEYHQNFVIGRSAEVRDVVLDTASSAVGAAGLAVFLAKKPPQMATRLLHKRQLDKIRNKGN